MALMIGDGPNRGKSAPPPRRLPKPKPGGASDRLSREFTAGIAARNVADKPRKSRTPSQFTYPILGSLFGKDKAGNDLPPERPEDKAADALFFRDLDEELKQQIRGESVDGQPVSTMRGIMPDIAGKASAAQGDMNIANQYAGKAKEYERQGLRAKREKADRTEKDKALTAREWARLTPMQQAAVQANADMADAVARDFKLLKMAHNPQKDWADQFNAKEAAAAELFGEDGRLGYKGLDDAPNTLAFLEERGIDKTALAGKTLDDLVSGDALMDMETVNALGENIPSDDPRAKNLVFARNLAKGQLAYQEKLAATLKRGDQLLGGMTSRTTNTAAADRYGAPRLPTNIKLTAVRPESVAQIAKYLEILARPDIDLAEGLDTISLDMKQHGIEGKEQEQVWASLHERTRQATTGEGDWFSGTDFEMRTPIEVAQALGAPTLKRAEGAQ